MEGEVSYLCRKIKERFGDKLKYHESIIRTIANAHLRHVEKHSQGEGSWSDPRNDYYHEQTMQLIKDKNWVQHATGWVCLLYLIFSFYVHCLKSAITW